MTKIKQIFIPKNDYDISFEDGWSNNLVENKVVKEISICGLPGSTFKFNNSHYEVSLGGSGLLNFECNDFPITTLQLKEETYNVLVEAENNVHYLIIDIVYEER